MHAAPDGTHTAFANRFNNVEWAKRMHAGQLARQTTVVKSIDALHEQAAF
jgi:hypothetical protein